MSSVWSLYYLSDYRNKQFLVNHKSKIQQMPNVFHIILFLYCFSDDNPQIIFQLIFKDVRTCIYVCENFKDCYRL